MASSRAKENRVVWFDFPVADLDRAAKFYTEVLGVGVEIFDHDGLRVGVFDHNASLGGCLVERPHEVSGDKGPFLYFNVNGRLKDAVARVAANGGKVVEDIHSMGQYGYRVTILDSEGSRLFLHSETER